MRRLFLLLTAVLTVSFGVALIARAGAAKAETEFRTPDAGAACRLEEGALVCSSLESAGSVRLGANSTPVGTRELPWWDASTPVLHCFRHGAISCRLHGATILCSNAHGAILVTRDGFAAAG
jgi:hypothetical protein